QRPSEDYRRKVMPQQDGDGVLVAASELPDDAIIGAGVGERDAQDGEPFWRADTDVLDLQVGRHLCFSSKLRRCAFLLDRGVSFVGSFTSLPPSVLRQLIVDRPTALLNLAGVSMVSLGTVTAGLK